MYSKTTMAGRLCADPEIKYTQSGVAVTNMRIAVDRPYKDKASGERKSDFHDLIAWRGTAEFAAEKLAKGALILVEARAENRDWEAKDGTKRRSTEFQVENLQVLVWPKNGGAGEGGPPAAEDASDDEFADQG